MWLWDVRVTTELILFFMYLGYIALRDEYPGSRQDPQWSVYAITAGALGVVVWFAKRRLAKELKNARQRQSSEEVGGKD